MSFKETNHPGCPLQPFRRVVFGGLFMALVLLAGCNAQDNSAEKDARSAMTRLLRCTVEEAEAFSAVLAEEGTVETAETGITSSGDGLATYAEERYGAVLSEDCIQQMLGNRSLFSSAALVRSSGGDVEPEFVRFERREGEEAGFDFTIDLNVVGQTEPVATATGNIFMEQTTDGWKASSITLSVQE